MVIWRLSIQEKTSSLLLHTFLKLHGFLAKEQETFLILLKQGPPLPPNFHIVVSRMLPPPNAWPLILRMPVVGVLETTKMPLQV